MTDCNTAIELRDDHAGWPQSRRATTGTPRQIHQRIACCSWFPRSGQVETDHLLRRTSAASMLFHRQTIPSIWSYSAEPAFSASANIPLLRVQGKRLATALALPKRSADSAFIGNRCAAYPPPRTPAAFSQTPLSGASTPCLDARTLRNQLARRVPKNSSSPPMSRRACV